MNSKHVFNKHVSVENNEALKYFALISVTNKIFVANKEDLIEVENIISIMNEEIAKVLNK